MIYIDKQWEKIPNFPYGETPEDLADDDPGMHRLVRVKRGLIGAYGDGANDIPEESVIDMLADLRHLCDTLGLDFAACDKVAYQHYLNEKSKNREA